MSQAALAWEMRSGLVMPGSIYIGCAGWNIRREHVDVFGAEGTHLERYACTFQCVEINSSFYRSHRRATYERWAASTPDAFRFAVKFPKQVTHERRLCGAEEMIEQFAAEVGGLGGKLGVVLVQLPPSLAFEAAVVEEFFRALRSHLSCSIACEPRHASWFEATAETLLDRHAIARVAADPGIVPAAAVPVGHGDCAYFRWHGSPRMYYSSYDDAALANLAEQLMAAARTAKPVWCIFDNTAAGAAVSNALTLKGQLTMGKTMDS
jgi:uncharacterized protein YecE (DUF72 family)